MISLAALLVAYAAVVSTIGRRVIRPLQDRIRHPLLGVATWILACVSVMAAWMLAWALAAGWHLPSIADVLLTGCLTAAEHHDDHGHLTVPALALPALVATGLRAVWIWARAYAVEIRVRRRHVDAVRLVGHPDRRLDAVVVDACEPAVYCLAGRRPTIVVTSEALRTLSADQLAAVLDHERCHLSERHHAFLRGFQAMARAFPFVPLFRDAAENIAILLEMRADDVAVRRNGVDPLIGALSAMLTGPPTRTALAAGGVCAPERVNRLVDRADEAWHGGWRLSVLSVALAAAPAAILLVPFCH